MFEYGWLLTLKSQQNKLIISLFIYCFVLVFPFVVFEIEIFGELYKATFSLLYAITNEGQALGFIGIVFLCLLFTTFYQIINIEDKQIQHYGSVLNLIFNSILIIGVWSIKNKLTDITGIDFTISIFFYFIYFFYLIYIGIYNFNYFVGPTNFEGKLKEIQSDRDILFNKSLENLKKKNMLKKKKLNNEDDNNPGK